jgi:hypothetical protein
MPQPQGLYTAQRANISMDFISALPKVGELGTLLLYLKRAYSITVDSVPECAVCPSLNPMPGHALSPSALLTLESRHLSIQSEFQFIEVYSI